MTSLANTDPYELITHPRWLAWADTWIGDGDFKAIVDSRLAVPAAVLKERLEQEAGVVIHIVPILGR